MNAARGSSRKRSGALVALCALAVLGTVLTQIDRIDLLAAVAAACAAGLVIAHRSIRTALRDTRMALLVVAVTALFDVATGGGMNGLRLFLRFSALVCAAQIVTASWSWSELSDAVVTLLRPLDRLGLVDAERCAFTLMLAIRFVPVMVEEIADIREAQAVRGLDRSVLALAVPLGLRILLRADEIAQAVDLRARPFSGSSRRGGRKPVAPPSLSSRVAS